MLFLSLSLSFRCCCCCYDATSSRCSHCGAESVFVSVSLCKSNCVVFTRAERCEQGCHLCWKRWESNHLRSVCTPFPSLLSSSLTRSPLHTHTLRYSLSTISAHRLLVFKSISAKHLILTHGILSDTSSPFSANVRRKRQTEAVPRKANAAAEHSGEKAPVELVGEVSRFVQPHISTPLPPSFLLCPACVLFTALARHEQDPQLLKIWRCS